MDGLPRKIKILRIRPTNFMIKRELFNNFVIIFLTFTLLIEVWTFIDLARYSGSNNMLKFISQNNLSSDIAAGVYVSGEDYYCVVTKGYSANQVSNTINHEVCHVLIDKDFEHFCGV
jgi:hypothetical protein